MEAIAISRGLSISTRRSQIGKVKDSPICKYIFVNYSCFLQWKTRPQDIPPNI